MKTHYVAACSKQSLPKIRAFVEEELRALNVQDAVTHQLVLTTTGPTFGTGDTIELVRVLDSQVITGPTVTGPNSSCSRWTRPVPTASFTITFVTKVRGSSSP